MASIQERLKLKRAPTDIWSVREQLCLASSVLKSGDQNWMSVSRSLKPIADKDSTRPPDWYSQKSCAQQYAYLLENADIPKRKKRESGETTSEYIVRRLTQDRIAELNRTMAAQRDEYQQLKNEIGLLKNGTISDEKLKKMWFAIEQEEKEQEQNNQAHLSWLNKRQQNKELQSQQALNIQSIQKKSNASMENQEVLETNVEEEDKRNKSGRSSLLTSLLKSPSPTTQTQTITHTTNSPTIASLLGSSPKVPGQEDSPTTPEIIQQPASNTTPSTPQERPSVNAPTLSMLLEQPSSGAQRSLQQQFQNSSTSINSKNISSSTQSPSTVQTRSARLAQGNSTQIQQVQSVIENSNLSSTEIAQLITNPIDQVMPKVIGMDKDEMNEIIGDIEALINEEITGSPQTLASSPSAVELIDNLPTQTTTERSELRNVDESVSLSNSPTSEIAIEDIDSSTSNIAEIIGTSITTVESQVTTVEFQKETEECPKSKFGSETIAKELSASLESEELQSKSEQVKDNEIDLKNEVVHKREQEECTLSNTETDIQIEKSKQFIVEKEEIFLNKEDDCEMTDISKLDETNENSTKLDEKCKASSSYSTNVYLNDASNSYLAKQKNEENFNKEILKITKETESLKEDSSTKEINNPSSYQDIKMKISKNDSESNNELKIEKVSKNESFVQDSNSKEEINQEFVQNSNSKEKINQESYRKSNCDSNFNSKNEISIEDCTILEKKSNCVKTDQVNNIQSKKDCTLINSNTDKELESEKLEEVLKNEIKENDNLKDSKLIDKIKIEPKKEDDEVNEEIKNESEIKKEIDTELVIKQEAIESVGSIDEMDEEEPTLSKLSGGRAMKTYSKKQNATVDSETENEGSGENADYRAWKKSIMLVYSRLATHKYASIFLRPITEDQAPGYHSIIFRPMDLWTIKKNIDNGTIRSTAHFQRDVMLMFQNAIMFNKHNTLVHKMTLEMQEECLQNMQVLVRVAGEGSLRRETRTAASISNDTADSALKRKWTHIIPGSHEIESSRTKKRRKSEND